MTFRNPIDPEIFAELLALQEATHPTLVQELVELFITSAKQGFDKMDAALKTGDMQALSDIAHGLKSSAANLGASDLSRLCLTLEHMDELPSATPEVHSLVAAIKSEFEIAERALHTQMKTAA